MFLNLDMIYITLCSSNATITKVKTQLGLMLQYYNIRLFVSDANSTISNKIAYFRSEYNISVEHNNFSEN